MIYIDVDMEDADESERAEAQKYLDSLKKLGAVISYSNTDEPIDLLKEKLMRILAEQNWKAGQVIGPQDIRTMVATGQLNPEEEKLLHEAVLSLQTDGVLDGNESGRPVLTPTGQRRIYRQK